MRANLFTIGVENAGPAPTSAADRGEVRNNSPMAIPAIPAAEALPLQSLITPTEQGIASRVLAKTAGGNLTLFAFDKGQELSEHATPFDALVMVLEGAITLTIEGRPVHATPGTIVRMPATVPHAVHAPEAARMLLLMLREPRETPPAGT
jgi:quercetin dioxygenase-like cupin family protein